MTYFTSILRHSRLFTNGTVIWIKMWVTTWRTSATSPRLEQGYSVTKTFDVITKSKLFPKTVSASASGTKIIANLSKRKTFLFSNIFSVFVGPSRCVRIHCHNNYFLHIGTTSICHRRFLHLALQHKIHFSAYLVHISRGCERYATQNKNKHQTRLLPFTLNYNHRQPFRDTFSRLVNHCVSILIFLWNPLRSEVIRMLNLCPLACESVSTYLIAIMRDLHRSKWY